MNGSGDYKITSCQLSTEFVYSEILKKEKNGSRKSRIYYKTNSI